MKHTDNRLPDHIRLLEDSLLDTPAEIRTKVMWATTDSLQEMWVSVFQVRTHF